MSGEISSVASRRKCIEKTNNGDLMKIALPSDSITELMLRYPPPRDHSSADAPVRTLLLCALVVCSELQTFTKLDGLKGASIAYQDR